MRRAADTDRPGWPFAAPMVAFDVHGEPVPKQSFRKTATGGYTDPRVKAWQERVGWAAKQAAQGAGPCECPVNVELGFCLSTRRRVDCDNLSKGVLDALTGILWQDDRQVADLHIRKIVGAPAGVHVIVWHKLPQTEVRP